MDVDRAQIARIVEEVVRRCTAGATLPAPPPSRASVGASPPDPRPGVFSTLDEAVAAARKAQQRWMELPLEKRAVCVRAMRETAQENARAMAELACAETGMGRVEDKYQKNLVAIHKTPGLEDIEPTVYTGDHGLTLMERAPFGVIGAITPTTNPVASIIHNSISMVCAGNAVVFNPHPRAKGCCLKMMVLLNGAIARSGGPETLLNSVAEPTQQTSQALMKHPGIDCLVVTGGPGVVHEAMRSGKKCIAAGPGNPPVVVDETADLPQAARDTVAGASFDNNVMCTCEKVVFVVEPVYREFLQRALGEGCHLLNPRQLEELTRVIFLPPAVGRTGVILNRDLVGQHACDIAKTIGLDLPRETRLLLAETPADHPLVREEQLMPVLPVVRVRDVNEAIALAVEAEGRCYHTAVMHSRNIDNLSRMARLVNTNIFIKNGPSYAGLGFGGEGHTTLTIAGTTGDGLTSARSFTRQRRCVLVDRFRIV